MNRGWIQLAASHPKLHRGPGSSLVATSDVTPVLVTWDTLESFSRDLAFGSVLRVPEAGLWGSEVNGNLVLAGSRLWVKPWIRFSGGWALHSCIGVRQLRGACVGWKGWAPSRESLLAQALLPQENPEIMPWWMMFFPCLREMQEERFAHLFASGNTKTPEAWGPIWLSRPPSLTLGKQKDAQHETRETKYVIAHQPSGRGCYIPLHLPRSCHTRVPLAVWSHVPPSWDRARSAAPPDPHI